MTKRHDDSSGVKVELISRVTKWLGLLSVSLLVYSCSAPPMKLTHISALDIKSQNIEKIRAGLEYLLGQDSAGIAAMAYVKDFEDRIEEFYPEDKNTVGTSPPIAQDNAQLAGLLWSNLPETRGGATVQEIQERSRAQIWSSFGKEMLRTSRLKLNEGYESSLASGNVGNTKLGFAAGYVALTLTPSVGDLEQIENKMIRLLDSLTIKH